MPARVRTRVLLFAAFVLALAAGIGAFVHSTRSGGDSGSTLIGGPYSLVDQNGATVTDRTFDGRLKLVLFGFTHCPDICPTGLAAVGAARDQLGDKADEVQPIFVSVDPERDTPQVLRDYLASFPGIVGLTGTPEAVAVAARAYRVYAAKVAADGGAVAEGASDYVVDHTALIYLMGRRGEYLGFFKIGASPDEIAAALRPLLD